MNPYVHCSIIYNSQNMEETQCPSIGEWTKVVCVFTMDYYSATKKNEIWSFLTSWMQLETIMLSEISQTEKDIYHMILLICGISKKSDKWTNKYNKTELQRTIRYLPEGRRRKEIVEGDKVFFRYKFSVAK